VLRGRRVALLAGAGVACVDLAYAVAAVLAGGVVTAAVSGRQDQVRLASALVLGGLAVRGLAASTRSASALSGDAPQLVGRGSAFWRFVALTAVNPLTAVYFTLLATGLGERVRSPLSATAFSLGVVSGSVLWQTGLALTGAALGTRLPPRARLWTSAAGYGVVLALAAALASSTL